MSEVIPLTELSRWLDDRLPTTGKMSVDLNLPQHRKISEIVVGDAPFMHVVQLNIPNEMPRGRSAETQGGDSPSDWFNGWAAILAATALLHPKCDAAQLRSLLHDGNRLRVCCDTNALAGGVVSWLSLVFRDRLDIVTSAVVDRELAAWPDRHGGKMFAAESASMWKVRTRYRIARATIERPLAGTVVDRLSPEQAALMLAKLRDEDPSERKSPDADMLLIELARSLVIARPRNAHLVYLTGDRNNARAATGALGQQSVLYAVSDGNDARRLRSSIIPRGWWSPTGGPLGSFRCPPVADFLWTLLCAGEKLTVNTDLGEATIEPALRLEQGCPSDWADPLVKATWADRSIAPATSRTQVRAASLDELPASPVEVSAVSGRAQAQPHISNHEADWSLRPRGAVTILHNSRSSWVLRPEDIFSCLQRAIFGHGQSPRGDQFTATSQAALRALGWVSGDCSKGEDTETPLQLWMCRDSDGFHQAFMAIRCYQEAIELLRSSDTKAPALTNRQRATLRLAEAFGQIGYLPGTRRPILGDASISSEDFILWLRAALPSGRARATEDIAEQALKELGLSPARFERAMMEITRLPHHPVKLLLGKGGTAPKMPAARVVHFSEDRWEWRDVSPSTLSFGTGAPVRTLERDE